MPTGPLTTKQPAPLNNMRDLEDGPANMAELLMPAYLPTDLLSSDFQLPQMPRLLSSTHQTTIICFMGGLATWEHLSKGA